MKKSKRLSSSISNRWVPSLMRYLKKKGIFLSKTFIHPFLSTLLGATLSLIGNTYNVIILWMSIFQNKPRINGQDHEVVDAWARLLCTRLGGFELNKLMSSHL